MLVFLSISWQQLSNWTPDILSFGLGILVGGLLLLAAQRLGPILWRWGQRQRGRAQQRFIEARASLDVRIKGETAVFAQQQHLGRNWADLNQVFVAPRFLAPQTDVDPEQLPDWGAVQLNYLWPELAAGVATPHVPEMTLNRLLRIARRVVVSAEPGAGKTTLLAHVAYRCAQATHDGEDAFLAPLMPILAHVANLDLTTAQAHPLSPLVGVLLAQGDELNRRAVYDLVNRRARAGRLLLLLDGWDELGEAGRTAVFAWLQALLQRYGDCRMILSAGPTGYGPLLSLDFTPTVMRPWRLSEVEAFAARWARVLSNNPLPTGRYWRPGRTALQTAQRFWLVAFGKEVSAAHRPQRVYDLMTACLVAFYAQELPTEGRGAVLAFWQRLAYALLAEGKLCLTADETAEIAGQGAGEETAVRQDVLLASLRQTPLFVVNQSGSVRFHSPVWRDYLAAQHLVDAGLAAEAEARVRDAAWCGALRFYVAQAGAERLAKHLLQAQVTSPLRNGLFQAASWISEAPDDGEWRRQTLILLGQLTRQRTFAQVLRQRAAAALVQTGESGRWAFVQQLLERSDPFMRRCGVVALSHLGLSDPAQAVELLTALQKDGDGLVRQLSVTALAWLATPQAEKPLLAALIEGDDVMRQAAAEGLARMGREGSEILREALEDESIAVRVAAVRAMAHMEAPWVAQTLSQVERQDAEWMVRGAASDVIVELEARDKVQPWLPLQPRGLRWLVNLATREGRVVPEGEAARPFLVQVMAQTTDPAVRAAAALALGQLPDPQVLPALETAVRESDPLVQEAAFVTFCQIDRAFGT